MEKALVHCELELSFLAGEKLTGNGSQTSTLPEFVPIMDKLLRGLTIGLVMGQYPIIRNIGEVLRNLSPFEGIFKELVR